jgi:hypothetical protein
LTVNACQIHLDSTVGGTVNRDHVHRSAFVPRARGLALAASAVIVLTTLSLRLVAMDCAAWHSALEPGPASPDQALAAIAGSVALALIVWLLAALMLSLLAALASGTSALGSVATDLARLVAPMILRNAVAALLGVAIAASPAAAAGAVHPAPHSRSSLITPTAPAARPALSGGELSPAWFPLPDRAPIVGAVAVATPTATGTATLASPAASPSGATPDPELLPGWIPSRPPKPSDANPAAAELAPLAAGPARARVDPDDQVVVRRGETLWDIAARHLGPGATDGEIAMEWPHWFTANRAVIGPDPDHLVPGERLRAPERAAPQRAAAGRRAPGQSVGRESSSDGASR